MEIAQLGTVPLWAKGRRTNIGAAFNSFAQKGTVPNWAILFFPMIVFAILVLFPGLQADII